MAVNTAKQFSAYMAKSWGAKYVRKLDSYDLHMRLEVIKRDCEHFCRVDIFEDKALPRGYNPASYGLWWSIVTGRLNGQTVNALKTMSTRQLCELVHTLLVECGDLAQGYPRWLMERYGSIDAA